MSKLKLQIKFAVSSNEYAVTKQDFKIENYPTTRNLTYKKANEI